MSVKRQRSDVDIDKHSYRRLAAAIILRAARDAKSCDPRVRDDAVMFLLSAANLNSWSRYLFNFADIDPDKTLARLLGKKEHSSSKMSYDQARELLRA